MAKTGRPRKKRIELPPIDQMPVKRQYNKKEIEKAVEDKEPWLTDVTTPKEVVTKMRKAGKIQMTEAQIANLRQFSNKPHDENAKKKSLENLRTYGLAEKVKAINIDGERIEAPVAEDGAIIIPPCLDEQYLRECLGPRELIFFVGRWNAYMAEHERDFNTAEDADDLQELLFCYILQMRMEKKKFSNPSYNFRADFSKIAQDVSIRIQTIKTALGTRRKDRIENNERKQSAFMGMVIEMAKNKASIANALEKRVVQHLEEDEFIARKLAKETALIDDN